MPLNTFVKLLTKVRKGQCTCSGHRQRERPNVPEDQTRVIRGGQRLSDVKLAFRCTRMFRTKGSRYACSRPRSMPKDVDGCSDATPPGNRAIWDQLESPNARRDPATLPRVACHLQLCGVFVSHSEVVGRHTQFLCAVENVWLILSVFAGL